MLADALAALTDLARDLGLSDAQWAERARVRKETLSRLRSRQTCDFETLRSLAQVVGARVGVLAVQPPGTTPDGHFPAEVGRDYEERLVELCASGQLDPAKWGALGPGFFMAGLAVMVASLARSNRRGLLALAEHLHPGASEPAVFGHWLQRSPVRPSRFLPLVDAQSSRAA